jgi:biotin transport system substrate-specific component
MKNGTTPIVFAALFAALICVAAVFSIPLPPPLPPFSPAVFFVLLSGLMLGPAGGGCAVAVYLLLGSLGLPVFANGGGGLGHFMSPTGGFLIGYLVRRHSVRRPGRSRDLEDREVAVRSVRGRRVLYAVGLPLMQRLSIPGRQPSGRRPS